MVSKDFTRHWQDWLSSRPDFNYRFTLVFDGWSPNLDVAKKYLRLFDARFNRKILGPGWTKRYDERLMAVWIAEGSAENVHWHGLCSIAKPLDIVQNAASEAWARLTMGSTVVQPNLKNSWSVDYGTKSIYDARLGEDIEIFGLAPA